MSYIFLNGDKTSEFKRAPAYFRYNSLTETACQFFSHFYWISVPFCVNKFDNTIIILIMIITTAATTTTTTTIVTIKLNNNNNNTNINNYKSGNNNNLNNNIFK